MFVFVRKGGGGGVGENYFLERGLGNTLFINFIFFIFYFIFYY